MKFNKHVLTLSVISLIIFAHSYAAHKTALTCDYREGTLTQLTKPVVITEKIKKEMHAQGITEEMIDSGLKHGEHSTIEGVDHYVYTIDNAHQIKFAVNKKSKLIHLKLLNPKIDNFLKKAKHLKGYEITPHFKQRMFERAITKNDVEAALKNKVIVSSDRTDGRVTYTYTNDQNETIDVVVDPIHRQLITVIPRGVGRSSKSASPVSQITTTAIDEPAIVESAEVIEQPKMIAKPIPQYSKAYLAKKAQREKEAWNRQLLEESNAIDEEDVSPLNKDIAKLGRSKAAIQYEKYLDEI